MPKDLKVLLVEDCESDAELIIYELKKAGFSPYTLRVDTRETMLTALRDTDWEIVLSDNAMPKFSSLEALRLKMDIKPDLPFIIVSGYLSDEIVFEAMSSGCREYVLKNCIGNLGIVIKRELSRLSRIT